MISVRLILGGFGRRAIELMVAGVVIAVLTAVIASAAAVVEGARVALYRFQQTERPDVIHVIGRFNRALFELPRRGNLPPATLPVYEPRIEPEELKLAVGNATIIKRQSLLRNVVTENDVSNVYVFGIDPQLEVKASSFHVAVGRFLAPDDQNVAVLDQASARSLGVHLGDSFKVRTAGNTDLSLIVVGILDSMELHAAPLSTVLAPVLEPSARVVTSGAFVPLRTSEDIFARSTLTDALVVAKSVDDVPRLSERIRQQFRLNTGVFVEERYTRYLRQVRDFRYTLALFWTVGVLASVLVSAIVAALLHDVYTDRRYQYAVLAAVGFSPLHLLSLIFAPSLLVAALGTIAGSLVAAALSPVQFQMPSLLADMVPVTPGFNGAVLAVVVIVALAAVSGGVARTTWMMARRPIAYSLRKGEL
jgi:ABC-type lipoprotein release transport system permease subunit